MVKLQGMTKTLKLVEKTGRIRGTTNAKVNEAPVYGMTETMRLGQRERRRSPDSEIRPLVVKPNQSTWAQDLSRLWKRHSNELLAYTIGMVVGGGAVWLSGRQAWGRRK